MNFSMSVVVIAMVSGVTPLPTAHAQNFPVKPITIVVGVPPGGSADLLARITADGLSKQLGMQVVVDNRPGANAVIATRQVARSAADGYTLFYNSTNMASNLVGMKEPGYKWSDFESLGGIAYAPYLMVVNTTSSSAKTLKEFVDYGKNNRRKLNYASLGPGSSPMIVAERFNALSGTGYVEVPYKGGAQALVDVIGGNVDLYFSVANASSVALGQSKVAILAITGDKRSEQLPNVPTFGEQGYPAMKDVNLGGLWVASATPKPILEKLRKALADTIKQPETVAALKRAGQSPYSGNHEQFDKDMQAFEATAREDYKKFKLEPL